MIKHKYNMIIKNKYRDFLMKNIMELKKQSMHKKEYILEKIGRNVKSLFHIILYGSFILLLFFLIIYVISEVKLSIIEIEKFNIAEKFIEEGYNSETIQNNLIDKINEFREKPEWKGGTKFIWYEIPKIIFENPIKFELPKTTISSESIIRLIRKLIRRETIVINGEIISKERTVQLTVRINNNKVPYIYEIKKFYSYNDNLDSLLIEAAEFILEIVDPYNLAAHLMFKNKDKAMQIIENNLNSDTVNDKDGYIFLLGMMHLNEGNINDAAEKFKKCIDINPQSSNAYFNLGYCFGVERNCSTAIIMYEKAIEKYNDHSSAYVNMSGCLIDEGEYNKAIEMCMKAININKYETGAYHYWGISLIKIGDTLEAIKMFQKAADIEPDIQVSFLNLGFYKMIIGDYESALESFNKALKIDSNKIEVYYYVGRCLAGMGDYKGACEAYKKAEYSDSLKMVSDMYYRWGNALVELSDINGAIEKYELVEKSDNDGEIKKIAKISISILRNKYIKIMLEVLKVDLRISNKPFLLLIGSKDIELMFDLIIEADEKKEERWLLPYFVFNIGENEAYNIRYYHALKHDSKIVVPEDSKMQNIIKNRILYRHCYNGCGYDIIYKKEYLKGINENKKYFRHFYVEYEDKSGDLYKYYTVWESSGIIDDGDLNIVKYIELDIDNKKL